MSVLRNPRHERFAQALAKGLSQADAYEEAGFITVARERYSLSANEKRCASTLETFRFLRGLQSCKSDKRHDRLASGIAAYRAPKSPKSSHVFMTTDGFDVSRPTVDRRPPAQRQTASQQ